MDLPGDLRWQLVGNAFHRSPRLHCWTVIILPPFVHEASAAVGGSGRVSRVGQRLPLGAGLLA
jgi:hypothetical protein